MSNSDDLNQTYLGARQELKNAKFVLPRESDERLAVEKSIDRLDAANIQRIQNEYSAGSNNLKALATQLSAIIDKLNVNPISTALESITGALEKVNTLAEKLSELASPADDA